MLARILILILVEDVLSLSLELCSTHTILTLENNRHVSRGIIYSPNYPENHACSRSQACTVEIRGLSNSSWIRVEQKFVELSAYSLPRTFLPCIEKDLYIRNDTLDSKEFRCPPREGTLLSQKSATFTLQFEQRVIPAFTIEYTIYPLINVDDGEINIFNETSQTLPYLWDMPEGYISLLSSRGYGNLTTIAPYPRKQQTHQIILAGIRNRTASIDMRLELTLGDYPDCDNHLGKIEGHSNRFRNYMQIHVDTLGNGLGVAYECNDAANFSSPIRFGWNVELFLQIRIDVLAFDMEIVNEMKFLIKYTVFACDENIPNVKSILHLEDAPRNPIYTVSCDEGYRLEGEERYFECRERYWVPFKPKCIPLYPPEVLDVKNSDGGGAVEVLIACNVFMFVITLIVLSWRVNYYRKSVEPAARFIPRSAPEPYATEEDDLYDDMTTLRPGNGASLRRAIEFDTVDLDLELSQYQQIEIQRLRAP